jgi:uncharacterized protein (UPF0179 family)
LTNGNVFIGNSSNVATPVAVTGDVTITNAGVTTIGTGKVDNTKLDKINIPLSGFGAASANVALGGNKLSGVADPTLAQDAATKSYVDSVTGAITTLADGKIYIGNASNIADEVTMNGDVTMSNAGVTTIDVGKVTSVKIFDGTIATVDIANDAVINTKLANDAVEEVKIKNDAVTTDKIKNNTIVNADISNTAAIQTTKIKGFYTGNIGSFPVTNSASITISISDLSIPNGGLGLSSTIIFQSNTSGVIVTNSIPETNLSGEYDKIRVNFVNSYTGNIYLSYIIILNN